MLQQKLKELEQKRKNGEISAKEFYNGLLQLVTELIDVLEKEDINEQNIRRQIPLLLTFLKAQIKNLQNRGH